MNSSYVEPSPVSTVDLAPSPVLLIDPRGEDPIRARLLGLERLESHARLMARACTLAPGGAPTVPYWNDLSTTNVSSHGFTINSPCAATSTELTRSGWSTTFTSLRIRSAKSLATCRRATMLSFPRSRLRRSWAIRAFTPWRWLWSPTPTASWTRHASCGLSRAFQESAPLTIGELWALPTMLRLVLLDNLRRLSEKMIWRWEERRRAEQWAKSALADTQGPYDEAKNKGPSQAPPPLTELSDPFVVRLLQLLRDQGPAITTLEHLEAELSAHGSEPNEVLKREQSRQAADQVTVGNCVLSLRLLSALDWNAFFEQSSHVEAILRDDPAGIYPRQEFATSDRYRRVVELIARQSDADEIEVSRKAVELAVAGPWLGRAA